MSHAHFDATAQVAENSSAAACGLTVLHARGRRLCKTLRSHGEPISYDGTRTFDLYAVTLAGFDDLVSILTGLARRRDCAVVRGGILDPGRRMHVRRLLHPDPDTGASPTLVEVPRSWLALDLDGVNLPAGADPRDLAACTRAVLPRLPPEFRHARVVVAATASHCIKPGARLRLWYWLSRAVNGAEAKRWLQGSPVDHSIFNPAQIIYTASPAIAPGATDPLPCRLLILTGTDVVVRVPLPIALAPPLRVLPATLPAHRSVTEGLSRYADAALAQAAASIAKAPLGSRHDTAKAEAWSLARLVRAGRLTEAQVKAAIGGAIEQAGKGRREGEELVAWAVARRVTTGTVQR